MIRLRRRTPRASALLPIAAIAGDALRLEGGALCAVLECPTLAFGIKGEAEQRAVVDGWRALLNSLAHPLQIVIQTRASDPGAVAPLPGPEGELRSSYQRLLRTLAGERRMVDRRFFVVVPADPVPSRRGASLAVSEDLEQRTRWVSECLRRIDLEPRRLCDHDLAELLRRTLDPAFTRQPLGADALEQPADLVAPSAVREQPAQIAVGERVARAFAVVRYPAQLAPGWIGDLATFDGDLDLALHLAPSGGASTMRFLERRIAELSSTLRLGDERGGRADPYRRIALADALELRDRLAQGTERLFDVTLSFTLWASDPEILETRSVALEALLGTRLVHSRRLHLQMRAGLLASLPLGRDSVGVRRLLSTSALAATFPFTGSDLRTRSGLLYGVSTGTRSPVVLDRFAMENHNAVVFATSGAGKSFLVKTELARAALSGVRAMVIDPEGEYAPLLRRLGAQVVELRPGAPSGIDPFALANDAPGALAARISSLTTLIALLVGSLAQHERAAVEEAVALAYAQAGFADGAPVAGLVPPRLETVQRHLRTRPDLERVAQALERSISGPGAWLFAGGAATTAVDGSVVYALSGLPESERAAAMFCMLERIWASLARSTQPTFVVVDEAWWLMRHPETAAFLFRLVKTARKRRAGLTLVTQDVSDVLAHPDGEALITNSALQILMRQAPQALPRLADLFRLTRAEQSFLLGAQQGEALLVAQGRRVPLQVIASDEENRLITAQQVAA